MGELQMDFYVWKAEFTIYDVKAFEKKSSKKFFLC